MEPAVLECLARRGGRLVIARRYVVAAHEDLAVFRDFDLDAADRLADRAASRMKRMIQGHDWRRFGEAVTLHDDEAKPAPERLEIRIERGGADDERPELEPEQLV